jgi:hypothetical protein
MGGRGSHDEGPVVVDIHPLKPGEGPPGQRGPSVRAIHDKWLSWPKKAILRAAKAGRENS